MATNGGSINYTVKYNIDKTGLNQMKASLQEILNLTQGDLIKINSKATKEDLKQLQDAAKAVGSALERAFNPNLGTLNVSKFNQELKKLNVDKLYKDFNIAGQAGRNAFRNITSDILTTNMQLKQTHTLLDNMATTMANTIKWGVASSVMNTFTGSVQQAYGYVKNLDGSLNDIRIVTNKSADEMAKFAVQANKAAKELGASTTSYTDASLIYYQQGLTDAEVAARAEVTLKAANVTGQSADAVSEQLTAVWNGYKVSAEEAELYIDKLAAVAATTASDLEELSVGMSKVASAANLMGVDVDQLNAQLATIVSVTRQAPESVGTALKTIYARMGDIEAGLDGETSLGNYTEQMAQMGYDVLDANGKLRDMGEVIEEIGNNWKNMSREQQISLSQTVAGTRQYNNLLALFDNWGMYTKAIETSGNAAGKLQEQQDIYMDRTVAHLQQLRTATEDLYDSLFETKSFNNLLDGITGAVDLLGNFADAIGGGGSALLLLGTIGTQVFSKQIASGLAVTIQNLITAQENTKKLKAEQEILNQYQNADITDARTKELINMKQKILNLDKAITNEERNIANEYIKQQNELYKQQDDLERKLQIAQEIYERTTGDSANISTQAGRNAAADELDSRRKEEFEALLSKDALDNISNVDKQYKIVSKELSTIKQQSVVDTTAQTKAEERLESAKINLMKATETQVDQAEGLIRNLTLSRENQDKLTQAVKEYRDLTKGGFDADNALHVAAAAKVQEVFKTVVKDTSKELETQSTVLRNHEAKVNANKQAVENTTLTFSQFIQQIDLRKSLQQFTTFIGKVGQLAMGINNLINLKNIWNNEDLTTGEKALQLTINLSMALPMLINGFSALFGVGSKAIKFFSSLNIAEEVAIAQKKRFYQLVKQEAKARGVSVALIDKETRAKLKQQAVGEIGNVVITKEILLNKIKSTVLGELITKQIKLMGIQMPLYAAILAVAGAAIALGAAVYGVVKIYNAEVDAAEKAREKQKELAESYKETKQAYDDLKSSLDKYEDAKKSLDEMIYGTREWRDAIQEVNSQVLDLIQKYPELASAVENSNGVLSLNEDAYQEVLDKKFNQTQSKYRASLQGTNDANNAAIKADAVKATREINGGIKKDSASGSYAAVSGPSTYGSSMSQMGYTPEQQTQEVVSQEQLLKVIDLTLKDSSLLGDATGNRFVNAVVDAGIASEEVAQALFDSQADWKELSTQIAANNEINKNLAQNKYSSYLSTNKDLQENDTYKVYQGLVTSILASKELNDTTVKSTATSNIAKLSNADKRAQYQKATGVSDEELADTKIKDITEFLIQEEVTRLIAENADEILADIEQLTTSENGSNIATFLQSGANAFSPEQIAELQGLNAQDLHDIYKGNEEIFTEYGYESVFAFINAFDKGLEEYDPKIYWENQLTQIKAELEDFGSSISTLLTGGELSDDQNKALDELESKYTDLAAIQDRSSSTYLERLIQIREALEEEQILAEQAIENAKIDELSEIKISADTNEFEEALVDIAEQDYEVLVAVKADIQSDFDSVTTVMSEMEEMASKIGDNFIVAASDLEELNDAFPGILNGIKYLNNGTVQLSQESVKAAMDAAEAEVAADTQKTIQKFENQKKELEAKRDAARTIANIAHKIVEGETTAADSQAQINQALNTLKSESSTEVSEQEQKDGINVAEQAAIASTSMADNYGRAYQSMADDSATFATIAQANLRAATSLDSPVMTTKGFTFNAFSANSNFGTVATAEKADLSQYADDFTNNIINWEDVAKYYDNLALSYDEALNNLIGKQAELLGSSTDFIKQASNISKGLGSDGKSSGKDKERDTIELLDEKEDIYHDINIEIDQLSRNLDRLNNKEDKLFGKNLINNLNQQLATLDKRIDAQKKKIEIAQKEANQLKKALSKQGVKFDENGNISNYISALEKSEAKVNSVISAYNKLDAEAQKEAKSGVEAEKKRHENLKKTIEKYEELINDTIPELTDSIEEDVNRKLEIQIKKFTMEVEIRLEMAEAERDWNEFKKKVLDGFDDDDPIGNALAAMADFSSYYKDSNTGEVQILTQHLNRTLEEYQKLQATGWSDVYGDNETQLLEDLEKYRTALQEALLNAQETVETVKEAYLDMIDLANEKFEEHIQQYETITDIIDQNVNLIKLLDGEDAYKSLGIYYKMQKENNLQQLDFQRQEVELWRQRMDGAEQGSEEWLAYREQWQTAVKDLNDTVASSIENLIAEYQNTVQSIFKDLNDKLTKGKGLEYVQEEWDLINKEAERYLDSVNATFEIQQLQYKYIDALNNTDSLHTQNKLNNLMNEQLEMLREKDKLTQYDVDRANLLYEIELKRIALEEAQRNKSEMRLRRDAQGNYSYQYVANKDKINEAQRELGAAQNELWNLDKEAYTGNLDDFNSIMSEFQESYAKLMSDQTLSEEEKERRKVLLQEHYGNIINQIIAENENIRYNLSAASIDAFADYQGTIIMENLVPQWNSGIQEMIDSFIAEGGFLPSCQGAFNQLDETTKTYQDSLKDLEKTAGMNFSNIRLGIDESIAHTQAFIEKNEDLIAEYDKELDRIEEIYKEVKKLITKYEESEKAAKKAAKAAYEFAQAAREAAAAAAAMNSAAGGGGRSSSSSSGSGSSSSSGSSGNKNSGNNLPSKSKTTEDNKKPNTGLYYIQTGNGNNGATFTVKNADGTTVNNDVSLTQKQVQDKYGKNIPLKGDLYDKKGNLIAKMNTGGYTGTWADGDKKGKLALLHQKELVLNAKDTSNILTAVKSVRSMQDILSALNTSMQARTGSLLSDLLNHRNNLNNGNNIVQQKVYIEAKFEGQTESAQIEKALDNLVNYASQYAFASSRF